VASISLEAAVALLGLSFLTPVPFDDILAIAAVILSLAAIGVQAYVDAIDEMIGFLQEDLDICILYEASDANEARQGVHDAINQHPFTQETLVREFLRHFIGYDSINLLFSEPPENINLDALPQGDCSQCGGGNECEAEDIDELMTVIQGTEVGRSLSGNELTLDVEAVFNYQGSNAWQAGPQLFDEFASTCAWNVVSVNVISGANDVYVNGGVSCAGVNPGVILDIQDTVGNDYKYLQFQSDTAQFTVRIVVTRQNAC